MAKLIDMIKDGNNNEEIKNFIKKNPEEINDDSARCNWTPLGVACNKGNLEIINYLLTNGADVESGNLYKTPLLITCYNVKISQNTKIAIIKSLVKNGADVNRGAAFDCSDQSSHYPIHLFPKNMTALDIAALYREAHVFNELLKMGATPERSIYPKMIKEYMSLGPRTTLLLFGMIKDTTLGCANSELAKFGLKTDDYFRKSFSHTINKLIDDASNERDKIFNYLKNIKFIK